MIWACIALISFVARMLLPYLEGRSNSWWVIPPIIPADLPVGLFLFLSCIVLLGYWLQSRITKRHTRLTAAIFFISLLLLGSSFIIYPAKIFHYGFHSYAKSVLTADEWRSISQFAQEHMQPGARLPGPDKPLWNETEHRALWSGLCAATPIQKLDPSLMIFVSADETEIVWGSPLTGHRAVIIYSNKSGDNHRSKRPQYMFVADDIATGVSAD